MSLSPLLSVIAIKEANDREVWDFLGKEGEWAPCFLVPSMIVNYRRWGGFLKYSSQEGVIC